MWYKLLTLEYANGGLVNHPSGTISSTAKGYRDKVQDPELHLAVCFVHDLMGLLRRFSQRFQVCESDYIFSNSCYTGLPLNYLNLT